MTEAPILTDKQLKKWWKMIKRTGCPEINDAINGRNYTDFDPSAIKTLNDFVMTSPPDTQAAPKSKRPKIK